MTDRMPIPSVGPSLDDIVAHPAQPMIGSYIRLMLLLCGDVSLNPGPRNWKCPCGVCHKPVKSNQQGLQCDPCDTWSHLKCLPEAIRVTNQDYARLSVTTENWYCFLCQLPLFIDSFFSSAESPLADDTNDEITSTSEVNNIFYELRSVMKKCPKNIIVSHLTINSLRIFFYELSDLFSSMLVDILFITETKLDPSFSLAQFDVPNYRSFRKDRTGRGGGILTYVRSDLPTRQHPDLELQHVECITIETTVCGRKWAIVCVYRPPSMLNASFIDDFTTGIDNVHAHFDNIIVIGDLNYDLVKPDKSQPLHTVCDIFDFTNLIKTPTCFMKDAHPSILDVILTNRTSLLFNITNSTCSISDWYNIISSVIKGAAPPPNKHKIKCRSYKHFDERVFSEAVGVIPFDVAYVFDDVDDIYWAHEVLLTHVLNEHVPIKEKTVKTKQTPFMNSKLRKAVFKSQCFSTNTKHGVLRPTGNLRNLCTKLKR